MSFWKLDMRWPGHLNWSGEKGEVVARPAGKAVTETRRALVDWGPWAESGLSLCHPSARSRAEPCQGHEMVGPILSHCLAVPHSPPTPYSMPPSPQSTCHRPRAQFTPLHPVGLAQGSWTTVVLGAGESGTSPKSHSE